MKIPHLSPHDLRRSCARLCHTSGGELEPENGPLTDSKADGGERVGRMELFAGAIACYKNPQSHRDVNLDDPLEVLEIIFLANHLLRIVDARARERGAKP
jgi:hypothetical protein